ncbi:class I adenylate-forming enzyme family protein [Treponema ruminis]|uniref:Acyl-CoA synthetase (AMP-forming)/AMP-acid ligase II n=1 Tax=Treponema ruminis TaxID=744515 RepID=A0A7W8LKT9_9SPIR|nr:class I adenylate-forming enzyme family protein [Treponema ruminis]MBB5224748.1 acyl-CoA synthetase (AMP-forming)/AMP-acid ligase II [Treponema ruminis]
MRTYDDSMFIDTFEHEYTWLKGFMRNVARFPHKNALIDPETNRFWDYELLNQESNRLALSLQSLGIGKNDIVMSALRNCPEFAFSYIGPRKIGAILLAANFNLAAGELALLINQNKPKAVIYSANIAKIIAEAEKLAQWKPQKFILADNVEKAELPQGHIFYEDFIKQAGTEEPKISFRPHIYDEVLRLCTSGTTALPKLVPLNDINEVLSAHDVIMHYPMNSNDVTMNMTPWFHRGGCHSGGVCPVFYAGACAVVMRKFQPTKALEWVEKYKITYLMGAPSNLAILARAQEKTKLNLESLKGLVTMGAPLSKVDCIRFMEILTPNIFNGYGTTETFWNSFLRPYNLPDGAGSVGASCTDDEVRVVKVFDDRKAEPDETVEKDNQSEGEIIIHAPEKTTFTYIDDPKMSAEKFYKGWLYTGDTGVWNQDLIVTVRGRKDDMIITSAENIYPTQIEEAINEHPKVKDTIVTSVPDKIRGQAVVAYVVPADKSLTIKELFDFCTNHKMLSAYKRPRYFALIDELPQTATGKKKHFEIKKRAAEDLKKGLLKKD